MNHIYRLVWSTLYQCQIPAAETARSHGQGRTGQTRAERRARRGKPDKASRAFWLTGGLAMCLSLPGFAQPLAADALPAGGQVVAGQVGIGSNGTQMTVNQASSRAIIDWQSFNIGSQAAVNFQQPNASAVALNRVVTGDASQILGQLNANGQVWLVNPNGVIFGRGSSVNVGGLVASTLDITNQDFLAGKAVFQRGNATGIIGNHGQITAADGGTVALLAPQVSNEGVISARLGNVVMAAGDRVTLNTGADGYLQVSIEPSTLRSLIENRQMIVADGGQILMTGRAASALSASVVANSGTLQARSLQEKDGKILLLADMQQGTLNAAGSLAAHFVETSAANVQLDKDLQVHTEGGHWLIDPVDITIGTAQASAINTALASGSVTVTTANTGDNTSWGGGTNGTGTDPGDIHINAPISWSANTLTLNADRNININAVMTASGTSVLAMNPGASGQVNTQLGGSGFSGRVDFPGRSGSGFLSIGGVAYTVINALGSAGSVTGTDLQGMSGALSGKYALGGNIDASATSSWNSGAGFLPVGDGDNQFTGVFDGLGHTISNLYIHRPDDNDAALFGQASNATFHNVGLTSVNIWGSRFVGGLVGENYTGNIDHVYVTGAVAGNDSVGGLVGYNDGSSNINTSYASSTVTGYALGGGEITFNSSIGGLVGTNDGNISQSYASGAVTGGSSVGGLVGTNSGSITNAYASGSVSGDENVGGLVGYASSGTLTNTYASGAVTGSTSAGGLLGPDASGVTNNSSYWDKQTTTQSTSPVGTGLTTPQMKTLASFAGWDISATGGDGKIWRIYPGDSYPLLRTFLTQQTLTAVADASKTYNAVAYSGGNGYTAAGATPSLVLYGGNAQGAVNAGSYTITAYSSQQGYDFLGAPTGTLTINKAPLQISTNAISKVYDGTTNASGSPVATAGTSLFGTDTLSGGSYTFDNKKVGTGKTVTVSGVTVNDGNGGANYNLIGYVANTGSSITPASLTVSGMTASNKVYDGTTTASLSGGTLSGVIGGDTVGISLAGNFADKNAGTGKPVSTSLTGADAGNYTLTQPAGLVATITPAALTVSGLTASSKVYDGSTAVALGGGVLSGIIGGDSVSLGASGSVADKNAGTGKAVSGSLMGADAGNYTLTQPAGLSISITPAPLTVSGLLAASKVYDGTTNVSLQGGSLSGVVGGDEVAISRTGSLADRNVGTNKAVTLNGSGLAGAAAGNYTLNPVAGLVVDVTPAWLTISGMRATSKVYDGSTVASLTGGVLTGVFGTDNVSFAGQRGQLADSHAGSGKPVTVYDTSLAGNDSGNYRLTQPAGLIADITPAPLTITANDASKVYGNSLRFDGSGFTARGLQGNESVASVMLTSQGAAASASITDSPYAIIPSAASGGTFDPGNYAITYVNGKLAVVLPAAQAPDGGQIERALQIHPLLVASGTEGDSSSSSGSGTSNGLSGGNGTLADFNSGNAAPPQQSLSYLTTRPGFITLGTVCTNVNKEEQPCTLDAGH